MHADLRTLPRNPTNSCQNIMVWCPRLVSQPSTITSHVKHNDFLHLLSRLVAIQRVPVKAGLENCWQIWVLYNKTLRTKFPCLHILLPLLAKGIDLPLSRYEFKHNLLPRLNFWFVRERPHGEESQNHSRLRRTLAPSAFNTRAPRSWLISHELRLIKSLIKTTSNVTLHA